MNKLNSYIFLALILVMAGSAFGQQIPVFNQYLYNPYIYNPARAGSEDLGRLFLGYKKQWTDMPGAPSTSSLTFDYPILGQRSGVGVTLYSDQTHIINQVGGSLTYAYHIVSGANDETRISMGVSAGFLSQSIDFEKARVQQANDNVILNNAQASTAFEAAFGFRYSYRRFSIDFSVPQLVNSSVRYLNNQGLNQQQVAEFNLVNHFLGAIRYEIPVSLENELYLEPVGMVRIVAGLPVQYDANFLLHWREQLTLGLGWRSGGPEGAFASGLNASIGFDINDYFTAAYIFEMSGPRNLRSIVGDTHEFTLGFRFGGTRQRVERLENKVNTLEESGLQMLMEEEKRRQDSLENVRKQGKSGMRPAFNYQGADSMGFSPEEWQLFERYKLYDDMRLMDELRQYKQMKQIDDMLKLKEIMDIQDRIKELEAERRRNESSQRPTSRGGGDLNLDEVLRIGQDGDTLHFLKLGEVYFDKDSYKLRSEEKARLNQVKQRYEKMSDVVVVYVTGNASTEGTDAYNMILSTNRCKAVRDHLKAAGMDDAVFMNIPYGEEDPLIEEDKSEDKREQNRRVDILILKN
jgi:type IX secretion system PorP/SprF family membrane protein